MSSHNSRGYEDALQRARVAESTMDADAFVGCMREAISKGYHPDHLQPHQKDLIERAGDSVSALVSLFSSNPQSSTYPQASRRTENHGSGFNYVAFGEDIERAERAAILNPDFIYQNVARKTRCLEAGGLRVRHLSEPARGALFKRRYLEYQRQKDNLKSVV